jgi:hypothetical protein
MTRIPTWSAEMDDIVRADRGICSAAITGAKIGKTRMAVLGRAGRLGLEPLTKALPRIHTPRRRRINGEIKIRKVPKREFASPPVPVEPLNIPFVALERHHCREVVGSEGFGMSLSCGHPVIHESSYCRWHHSINTEKFTRRPPSTFRFAA